MKNKVGLKIGDKLLHKMYNEVVTIVDFLDDFDGESVSPEKSKYVVYELAESARNDEQRIDQDNWKYLKKIKKI